MKRKGALLTALLILGILAGANSTWGAGGDLVWEKTFNVSPNNPYMSSLAVSSTVCIVNTTALVPGTLFNEYVGYIKAYNMATGDLKWDRTLTGVDFSSDSIIGIDNNIVYIRDGSTLGAYDANTGQPLWEKNLPLGGSFHMYLPVPLVNNRIFLLGRGVGDSEVVLRVYQAKNVDQSGTNSLLLLNK